MEGAWLASYLVLWSLVGLLALLVLGLRRQVGLLQLRSRPMPEPGIPVGSPAPAFAGTDLAGKVVPLSDLSGKKVVLFVSPHCPPCKELLAKLNGQAEELRRNGMHVVLMSQGPVEENQAMRDQYGVPFPLVVQRDREITDLYQATATPLGFAIDEKGTVIGKGVVNTPEKIRELFETPDKVAYER